MSILLFSNLKGGVAKTTSAVAVAECLASEGYRTLLIDADHQCMAGELLLGESRLLKCDRRKITLHDLLAAMIDDEFTAEQLPAYVEQGASDIAGGMENLSVIPCSIRIDDFSTNMAKAKRGYASSDEFYNVIRKRRDVFRRWLKNSFDFTIVDCPPSIPVQVRMMLTVGDGYIVPCVPDRLSVRGSLWLEDRIRRLGVKINGIGTLWSLYRKQTALHQKTVIAAARGSHPYDLLPRPFETVIPNSTAIAESTEADRNPRSFDVKYTPQFAKLFRQLTEEIIQRSQWSSNARKAEEAAV